MSLSLTKRTIFSLCGRNSFDKGETYYRSGKVTIMRYDPEQSICEATVKVNGSFFVSIEAGHAGRLEATCSCPSLSSYEYYCQHIAAVLLSLHDIPSTGWTSRAGSSVSPDISSRVLELFSNRVQRPASGHSLIDMRERMQVEFICKPVHYGNQRYMMGVELRTGPKRLYIVQKIREFLERISQREPYPFSAHFTYDPGKHSFGKEDDAVIRQLIQIYQQEKMYRETATVPSVQSNKLSGERMLLVPPYLWKTLLPTLLAARTVKLEYGEQTYEGIEVHEEKLPLQFRFDEAQSTGFQMEFHGMEEVLVLESYELVLLRGKLYKLQAEQCTRLGQLKRLVDGSNNQSILISHAQMEPFMVNAISGLKKLGTVLIEPAVAQRVMQKPLQAKLYLDRVKDRLLAGLEFQYGDIVINPLEGLDQKRGTDLILMRDGEKERRILDFMDQSAFVKTEGGYFMEDEDAEYDFLYHVVPQMEELVRVYATAAVKVRLHPDHVTPKVSVDLDDRIDWLKFEFNLDGIPESQIRQVLQAIEEKRKYYRMPSGAFVSLEGEAFQDMSQFMEEMGIGQRELRGGPIRLPVVRGLQLIDSQRQSNTVKLGKSFRKLLENMRNPDNLEFPVPEGLKAVLRDYQVYGYQWLKTLAFYRFGGILADDMGLGKTVQSIAFLVSVLPEIREKQLPALIVSPASLMYNWRNELRKFAPQLRTVIADGTKAERDHTLHDLSEADVIITSYPLLRRDIARYAGQSFHTLILDEAQAFKNHTTQTAQAVKEIAATYRFALTGTPIENRLEELWSIFDAVFPELFAGRKAFNELSRETVAKRTRPFLLRRVKKDVLKELPDKIEMLQASELLPDQKKLYAAYLAQLQEETLKHLSKDGFQKHRIKILAGLTRLRQLCCHPALFVEGYEGSSAKFEQLMEILQECVSAGRRVLVFSQFTEMLGLIGRELGYQGVPFFYLDGNTPATERVELCNRFNEGERDLFLASLKAGGTGLNLTGADTVILYDLWWNPAVEQQAADRAHRIGQKNVVQVIRLVTEGTVEEKMHVLQQKKKNLIEEVIQPGEESLSTLSEREIREILMLD